MFKEEIRSTALTTSGANDVFLDRITASTFRGDVSMAAMARVLFDQRLGEGEKIKIFADDQFYTASSVVDRISKTILNPGELLVLNVSARPDDSGKWKAAVKDRIPDGYFIMDDLEKWFEMSKIQTVILTDRPHDPAVKKSPVDNTRTIVVMENLNTIRWHLIASLLPRLLGKWFMEIPRTEYEVKNILCAIVGDSPDLFLEAISEAAKKYDFRSASIKRMLGDFETKYEKQRMESLETRSREIEQEIERYSEEIGSLLTQKEEILATLYGFQILGKKSEPLTMNYFLANKNLFLQSVSDSRIDFYATSWFSNWDPEKADAIFGRDHCGAWLEYNERYKISDEDAKRLYKAIFLTEEVKVRLWSHYRLSLRDSSPIRVFDDGACSEIQNALPNPHHHYNTCLGDNRRYINACMLRGDVVGAIEQCISATGGINLTEHVSYHYFTKDLFNPKFGKVIYINETGKFETAKDAIKWLKEKDEQQKKKEAEKKTAKEEQHV